MAGVSGNPLQRSFEHFQTMRAAPVHAQGALRAVLGMKNGHFLWLGRCRLRLLSEEPFRLIASALSYVSLPVG